ncbi:MAG: ArsA family ATPase [SAR324 cluster bacterium]|nr:ArsA family ATPase [SAR324 cluster bacterium]
MSELLNQTLKNHKIVINCGCGGVGKTTISAALGIRAAEMGLKVIVLTIDPAKRLADSLGIGSITNEPKKVPLTSGVQGEMWAMMLDVRDTIRNLVVRNATSEQQVRNILNNHIYQQLSHSMGGGQEYGAMEGLYALHLKNEYDLIILDTPPSQHALDFISAPLKLKEFFGQSVLKYFLEGQKEQIGRSLAGKGGNLALKLFEKLTGSHFLSDLSDFLGNFQGMYEAIRDEAEQVSDLLASNETAFLAVSSPEKQQLIESFSLTRKLLEFHLPFKGLLINKCTPEFNFSSSAEIPHELGQALERLLLNHQKHVNHENDMIRSIIGELPSSVFIQKLPIFPRDVHNMEILMELNYTMD